MVVGVFGGSFNPPHLAHLLIAEMARQELGFDQVWWMPAATPPHKQIAGAVTAAQRFEMVKQAIAGNPFFVACDLELQRTGKSYTVETLRLLQAQYPDVVFHLIIGGDSLQQFHTWYAPDEILARVPLAVYHRPGTDLSQVSPSVLTRTTFIEAPLLQISSTAIREKCAQGKSIRYWVPDPVMAYIEAETLYQ